MTAARFRTRGPEPEERAVFDDALAEIAGQVRAGNPVGWVAALGLGPRPLTPADGAAEHVTDDRVSVRIGANSGQFERGMLIGLSVALEEWFEIAERALATCPVERVSVRDVPGMAFWVEPPTREQSGWTLTASLTIQPRPTAGGFWQRLFDRLKAPDPDQLGPTEPRRWAVGENFPHRPALVAGVAAGSARLVDRLKDEAAGW